MALCADNCWQQLSFFVISNSPSNVAPRSMLEQIDKNYVQYSLALIDFLEVELLDPLGGSNKQTIKRRIGHFRGFSRFSFVRFSVYFRVSFHCFCAGSVILFASIHKSDEGIPVQQAGVSSPPWKLFQYPE